MKAIIVLLVLVPIGIIVLFLFKAKASREGGGPKGIQNGKLYACSDKPNCVSTEASDESHLVSRLTIPSGMDSDKAMLQIREVITESGGLVKEADSNYLAAEFTSSLFGFVDDVELLMELNGNAIQFRSESRQGYSDLGANRKRYEKLKSLWQAKTGT